MRWNWAALVAAGLLLVGAELVRAPQALLAAGGMFALVWWVRHRRSAARRRHRARLHRLKREVVANALFALLLLAATALAITAVELSNESTPLPGDPVQVTDADPRAKALLMNGAISVLGLAVIVIGQRGLVRHRRGRRRRTTSRPSVNLTFTRSEETAGPAS